MYYQLLKPLSVCRCCRPDHSLFEKSVTPRFSVVCTPRRRMRRLNARSAGRCACLVHLTHADPQGAGPTAVEFTKMAVTIALRMLGLIFLPEQHQGHPFALQLVMKVDAVRQRTFGGRCRRNRRKQLSTQLRFGQPLRQGPVLGLTYRVAAGCVGSAEKNLGRPLADYSAKLSHDLWRRIE